MSHDEAMVEVREAFRLASLPETGFWGLMRMIEGLGYVLLNAPDSAQSLIRAAIINAERRAAYMATRGLLMAGTPVDPTETEREA